MGLLEDILARTPQAKGRLLVDLINEPDGYSLTWDVSTTPPLFAAKTAQFELEEMHSLHIPNHHLHVESMFRFSWSRQAVHSALLGNLLQYKPGQLPQKPYVICDAVAMQGSNGYPAITDLYLHALPRIWKACPDCLLLIEGRWHESQQHLQSEAMYIWEFLRPLTCRREQAQELL